MHLAALTIRELQTLLAQGEIEPRDIIASLQAAKAERDGELHGYLSWDVDEALAACGADSSATLLRGIPIAIKDLINVKGQPCTCASKMLEHFVSPYDATVIEKLKRAGGIPFGRANMDEFAMGSSTENSAFGPSRNPWDPERIPGGSSGGAAVVVAADEAIAALGSDTGGSIRQPAALCGCVGLRPTYGRVSRFGLVAFASSLDQIGPITKTVEDAAILLGVISGADPKDSTCLDEPVPDYLRSLEGDIAGMKLGLPRDYFGPGLDPQIRETVETAVKHFENLGAEIVEISLPNTDYGIAVYYIIATAEASSNLARFDGVRYGHRTAKAADLGEHYRKTRAEGFGAEVKRRILLGTYVLSSGYYDAYYLRAQKLRTLIRDDFRKAFEKVDVLITPTTPSPAFKMGENADDPLAMYLADVFTIGANLAGICGISIPCGFVRDPQSHRELPVGLQLLGAPFAEPKILRLAHRYEQSTTWKDKRCFPLPEAGGHTT